MATFPAQDDSTTSLMPGTYDAQDYAEINDDPFEVLARIQEAWRKREPPPPWSTTNLSGLEPPNVLWHVYDTPAALSRTPGVTDEVLLGIIQSSIDKMKALAAEENQRWKEAEAVKKQQKEAGGRTQTEKLLGPGGDPYLPIIIVDETTPKQRESDEQGQLVSNSHLQELIDSPNNPVLPAKNDIVAAAHRVEAVRAMRQSLEKSKTYVLRKRLFSRGSGKSTDKSDKARNISENSGLDFWKRRLVETSNHVKQQVDTEVQVPGKAEATEDIEELVECVSCLDEFPIGQLVKVPCHSYCSGCFAGLVSTGVQNEQQWPPKCCLNEIPFRTILKYAPEDLQQRFKDRASEWNTPATQRVYCGHADCSIWIRPEHINQAFRQGRCSSGHWTCTICHGPEHGNNDCPQDRDMALTNQLAEEAGWKRCYNCNALVEHKEACQHMSCRCGSQFCYVCCRRWRTCSCTIEQLQELKSAAETRRTEREAKERMEAEELRQMLAEIEEFEREEELKAEMLRQEQIRKEEERQLRELEGRVRRETARRKHVEKQFAELRLALGQLHDLQRVMIKADQVEAAESLKHNISVAEQQLEAKQAEDKENIAADIHTKLKEKEVLFNHDFATRAAAEKKLLDEYYGKLIAYYQNRPEGSGEIAKAMVPVQQEMEDSYREWQKLKKQEMIAYRYALEEEQVIKDELAHSTMERLADQHRGMTIGLTEKDAAEKHWFKLVVLERERLLAELELQKMEGDTDSLFVMGESVSGMDEEGVRSASRASSSDQHSFSSAEMKVARGDEVSEGPAPRLMPIESALTTHLWTAGTALTTEIQSVPKTQSLDFRWGRVVNSLGESSTAAAAGEGTMTPGMAY